MISDSQRGPKLALENPSGSMQKVRKQPRAEREDVQFLSTQEGLNPQEKEDTQPQTQVAKLGEDIIVQETENLKIPRVSVGLSCSYIGEDSEDPNQPYSPSVQSQQFNKTTIETKKVSSSQREDNKKLEEKTQEYFDVDINVADQNLHFHIPSKDNVLQVNQNELTDDYLSKKQEAIMESGKELPFRSLQINKKLLLNSPLLVSMNRSQTCTNTQSPKMFFSQNTHGLLQAGNNAGGINEGLSQGLSGSNGSTQLQLGHPVNSFLLSQIYSTGSFKTILKKDRSNLTYSDSISTFHEQTSLGALQPHGEIVQKKSGKVQFKQEREVVNYEERSQEKKTGSLYEDVLFESEENEEDPNDFFKSSEQNQRKNQVLALQSRSQQQQNLQLQQSQNYLRNKITVLEQVNNEQEREGNFSSTNFKGSDGLSLSSPDLLYKKDINPSITFNLTNNTISNRLKMNELNASLNYQLDNKISNYLDKNNEEIANKNGEAVVKFNELPLSQLDSLFMSNTYIPSNVTNLEDPEEKHKKKEQEDLNQDSQQYQQQQQQYQQQYSQQKSQVNQEKDEDNLPQSSQVKIQDSLLLAKRLTEQRNFNNNDNSQLRYQQLLFTQTEEKKDPQLKEIIDTHSEDMPPLQSSIEEKRKVKTQLKEGKTLLAFESLDSKQPKRPSNNSLGIYGYNIIGKEQAKREQSIDEEKLRQIMDRIQIVSGPGPSTKQLLKKQKTQQACSRQNSNSTCNIFQRIWRR